MRFVTTIPRHSPWNHHHSAWDLLSQFNTEFASLRDGDLSTLRTDKETMAKPAMDFEPGAEDYKLSFDLPGLKKEDIKIDLNGRTLKIYGERKFEKKTEGHFERRQGLFSRTIELPEDVNTESVKAIYENGVLELIIAKSEKAKAREIKVS